MKVADFMSRDVVSVAPEMPILRAAELMIHHHISGLPVIDAEGRVVGIVSEPDLLRPRKADGDAQSQRWLEAMLKHEVPPEGDEFAGRKVGDVMTPDPATIAPNASLDQACHAIQKLGVKRLPVVDNGKLVGVIARSDLVRALARALKSTQIADDVSIKQRIDELERRILRQRARALEPF
jgi:CBS domain-containing protein